MIVQEMTLIRKIEAMRYSQDEEELNLANRKIQYLEKKLEEQKLSQKIEALEYSEEEEKLNGKIKSLEEEEEKPRKKTPNLIGDEGEDFFLRKIREAFPEDLAMKIARKKNRGDVKLDIQGSCLMFEIKNISNRVVPMKDRKKFFNDLTSNSYIGGILVSLQSRVDPSVKPSQVHTYEGKKYVFLDRFQTEPDQVNLLRKVVGKMISDIQ